MQQPEASRGCRLHGRAWGRGEPQVGEKGDPLQFAGQEINECDPLIHGGRGAAGAPPTAKSSAG